MAVWKQMIADPKTLILLGFSGAMIPAGMQEEFFNLANAAAKGDAQLKILE